MNCISCGKTAQRVQEARSAQYRGDTVQLQDEFFRCDSCGEEFVTPEQIRVHARAVRNEIRKKCGLLSPEKIIEIRKKRELTQADLEELLGTGEKVVVRWESGKVIQSAAHDLVLRMLDRDPSSVRLLQELSKVRASERQEYSQSHGSRNHMAAAAQTM